MVEEGAEADHVYFLVAGEVAVTLRGALVTFIEAPSVAGLLVVLECTAIWSLNSIVPVDLKDIIKKFHIEFVIFNYEYSF